MVPTLSRNQARELDRRAVEEFGLPGIVLMENAGRGAAELLLSLRARGPVVICCGRGNNGGDGFVIARHLDLAGVAVRVCLWAMPEELRGDAAINFEVMRRAGLAIEVFGSRHDRRRLEDCLAGSDWIVDALLGTGARGNPKSPLAEVIDQLNGQPRPILAVDVPSGLDCDRGLPSSFTIRAGHTCTFVAAKPGFLVPGAASFLGQLHVLQIGAPRRLVEDQLAIGGSQEAGAGD